ncbi:hypothetical protein FGLOB1_3019 [Fusarium globosum]|uniref:Zn(2)-C6 fungal-type domain-containing protein n=1 Tax=Fusarium globosum TaxID=78864 RepID=A0A8H5YPT2_9HYPO|nr:hypothetical protein FGLOB1_3019 [Fusarium globosum]
MTSSQRAPRVCRICRIKKKACGKELPTCSYCFKRGFDCVYESESDTSPINDVVAEVFKPWSLTLFPMSISTATLDRTMAYHMQYLHKAVGQSPLQAGQRFLDNFQRWLPIIAPRRLHEHIELSEQGLPGADVSILLLSICLVTLRSGGDLDDPFLHSSAVHATVKTLYAQVQAITHASIALVQAGVVLSAYEYASGQIDSAYISIAACIRMAQVVDVDTAYEKLGATQEETRLQATSEWNLWWSIIVLERFILLEHSNTGRRNPIAICPDSDVPLPSDTESNGEYIPSYCTMSSSTIQSSSNLSSFGRQAQAIYLLDRCLHEIHQSKQGESESQLLKLQELDKDLQERLSTFMTQTPHEPGLRCGTIATIYQMDTDESSWLGHDLFEPLSDIRRRYRDPSIVTQVVHIQAANVPQQKSLEFLEKLECLYFTDRDDTSSTPSTLSLDTINAFKQRNTSNQLQLLTDILSGKFVAKRGTSYVLSSAERALDALQLLHYITSDTWFSRGWTYQENYRANMKMKVLIAHSAALNHEKAARHFGSLDGELLISSAGLYEQATKLCMAYSDQKPPPPCLNTVLLKAKRYTILLASDEDSAPVSMSPSIIEDIASRKLEREWDRVAIIANCCQYTNRLNSAQLQSDRHSLSLTILTLVLMNGEILSNHPEDKLDATKMTITEFLHEHFFYGLESPWEKAKLTFNKRCRFANVILTEEGVQTEGYLWRLDDEIITTQFQNRLRPRGKKRRRQLTKRPLEWLAEELAPHYRVLSQRLDEIMDLEVPSSAAEEWLLTTLLGPGPLGVAVFVQPEDSDDESSGTGSEMSLDGDEDCYVFTSFQRAQTDRGGFDLNDLDKHVSLEVDYDPGKGYAQLTLAHAARLQLFQSKTATSTASVDATQTTTTATESDSETGTTIVVETTSTASSAGSTTTSLVDTTTTTAAITTAETIEATTTTAAATTTTEGPEAVQSIYMYSHSSSNPAFAGNGGTGFATLSDTQIPDVEYIDFTTVPGTLFFTLGERSGKVKIGNGADVGKLVGYFPSSDYSLVIAAETTLAEENGVTPLDCDIVSPNGYPIIQCQYGDLGLADFWTCGGHWTLVKPGYDFTTKCPSASTAYKLDYIEADYVQ